MLSSVLLAGLLFGQIGNGSGSEPPEDDDRPVVEPVIVETVIDDVPGSQEQERPAPAARSTREWRSYITAWRRNVLAKYEPGYQFWAEDLRPLLAIRDEKAVPALISLLRNERERRIRTAYMEALAAVGGKPALDALVRLSLDDPYGYQRLAAELISHMPNRHEAISKYAAGLHVESTRAAALVALRRSGLTERLPYGETPDPVLIRALVDSLVVKQVQKVPAFAYSERARARGPIYGWHYRQGYIPVQGDVPNEPAKAVLEEYTGQNFGYDRDAWKRWDASWERKE